MGTFFLRSEKELILAMLPGFLPVSTDLFSPSPDVCIRWIRPARSRDRQ